MTRQGLPEPELLDWLRLINCENVGPATFHALLERFGSAGRALDCLPELAARAGRKRLRLCSPREAEAMLDAAEKAGARFIAISDPDYPPLLRHIDSAPPLLCVRGRSSMLPKPAVGIVGSRRASAGGITLARQFASDLGRAGYVIVSGLARGIDTAAHVASLETGTIAVMAGGIDVIYPPQNEALAARIVETGLLVTEMMPGASPQAQHFPRRNRIIAGLSLGVLVVEAAERSGSLITARLAIEQGREVFAVPGSPLDPRSGGTNGLIRNGAVLATRAADIIEALAFRVREEDRGGFAAPDQNLGPRLSGGPEPAPLHEISDQKRGELLALLGPTPVSIDILARESGLEMGPLLDMLLELELSGRLVRSDGRSVALVGLPEPDRP